MPLPINSSPSTNTPLVAGHFIFSVYLIGHTVMGSKLVTATDCTYDIITTVNEIDNSCVFPLCRCRNFFGNYFYRKFSVSLTVPDVIVAVRVTFTFLPSVGLVTLPAAESTASSELFHVMLLPFSPVTGNVISSFVEDTTVNASLSFLTFFSVFCFCLFLWI